MKNLRKITLIALLLAASLFAKAEPPPTAEALGLMVGSPPGNNKTVTIENAFIAPFNRWSFLHMRELFPTRGIAPPAAVSVLKQEPVLNHLL